MVKSKIFYFLLAIVLVFPACNEDDDVKPENLIAAKWIITTGYLLGISVPGDGSYVTFSGGLSGTGTGFAASDTTSGTFTYDMNAEATTISIIDTTNAGGNYNGEWDILELTEDDFRIAGNTIFGTVQLDMSR